MSKHWQHEPFYWAPTPKLGGGWIACKDSPSPPAAPDYVGAANAQGAANVEAAKTQGKINNPNIFTPYGSQTVTWSNGAPVFNEKGFNDATAAYNASLQAPFGYVDQGDGTWYDNNSGSVWSPPTNAVAPTREQFTVTPENDQPTVTQTLAPQSQQIFDAQQNTRLGLAGLSNKGVGIAEGVLGKEFNPNLPNVRTDLDTSGIAKMPVNAGMLGQDAIMSRLEPAFARQRTSLETQLTNQGLRPGGEAWDNAMKDFSQQQTDARTQAALQGINLDMAANNQGFNQSLQSGQFGNTAQNQALVQALQKRSLPLNEITALMSGSQIQNPQFQGYSGSSVAPAPIFGAAQAQGGANMGLFNAQQGAANAQMNGLFQLGAAALGAPTGTFRF